MTVSAPNGLASIDFGGTNVTLSQLSAASSTHPVVIATPDGTLSITGYNVGTGVLDYTYAISAPVTAAGNVTDSIAITVHDTAGLASGGSALTVTITDDAPTARDDQAATVAGHSVTGSLADNDTVGADGPGTWALAGGPAHGKVVVNTDGSYTYTPDNGYAGRDSFTYTLTDKDGDVSTATAWVSVNTSGNPVAAPDTGSVVEAGVNPGNVPFAGTPTASGNVLANDSDPNTGFTMNLVSVNGVAVAANGTTTINGVYGTLTIAADGTYTYALDNSRPVTNALAQGQTATESFTYTLHDNAGLAASSNLTVTVTGTNDAPVAVADFASVVASGVNPGNAVFAGTPTASGNVLANDTDVDTGDTKTMTSVNGTTVAATGTTTINGTYGTLTIAADGTYTYALDNARTATQSLAQGQQATETFNYVMHDAHNATASSTLTVTVTGTNNAPEANPDTASVVEQGGSPRDGAYFAGTPVASGNVLANDTDVDTGDTKTMTSVNGTTVAATGTTTINGTYGTLTIAADGSYTYTLDNTRMATQSLAQGQQATETFNYVMHDGSNATASSVLTVNVTGTNDAPVLGKTTISTQPGLSELIQWDGGANVTAAWAGNIGNQMTGGSNSPLTSGPYIGSNASATADALFVYNDNTSTGPGYVTLTSKSVFQVTAGTDYTFTFDAQSNSLFNDKSINFKWVLVDTSTGMPAQDLTGWYNTWTMPGAQNNFAHGVMNSDWANFTLNVTAAASGNYKLGLEWVNAGVSNPAGSGTYGAQDMTFDRIQLSQQPPSVGALMAGVAAGVTDVDAGATLKGWAFTSAGSNASGTWQYSADGGTTWNDMSSASANHAFFLASSDLIRWTGQHGTNTPLSVFAVDNTYAGSFDTTATGSANLSGGTGGSSAFSSNSAMLAANMAPVVLDLNHDGQISYASQVMHFQGNDQAYATAWAANGDGVLVWNKYGDGQVHDSSQYAFSQYGAAGSTDLQGLAAAFDSNHDGKLDAGDAKFAQFSVWVDGNHNGVVDPGEMHTLADLGITSINLVSDGVSQHPAPGVTESGHSSATLSNGGTLTVADATFEYTALNTVSGTAGSDRLSGLGSNDLFVWHLADHGTAAAPAVDTIVNFNASTTNGDRLDLRDLLQGEHHVGSDVGNLADYLHFSVSNGSTTIDVKSQGAGLAGPDQKIVLSGVDLAADVVVAAGQTADQAIIHDLLSKGKIVVD